MKELPLTVQKFIEKAEYDSLDEAITWANTYLLDRPEIPKKPSLKSNHSSADVLQYANQLKQYESDMVEFDDIMTNYRSNKMNVESIIVDGIKVMSGFNAYVPAQYKDKVFAYVHDRYSSGYSSLYNQLTQLSEIFC